MQKEKQLLYAMQPMLLLLNSNTAFINTIQVTGSKNRPGLCPATAIWG